MARKYPTVPKPNAAMVTVVREIQVRVVRSSGAACGTSPCPCCDELDPPGIRSLLVHNWCPLWLNRQAWAGQFLASIQAPVFVVLGAGGGDLGGQSRFRQLIHPDPVRNRCRARHRSALGRGLGRGRCLCAELPS
jgi:hypothetical protein